MTNEGTYETGFLVSYSFCFFGVSSGIAMESMWSES